MICGNCGCNSEWEGEFSVDPDGSSHPEGLKFTLACKNCATLHFISDLMPLVTNPTTGE
jgi:hypothetical protein